MMVWYIIVLLTVVLLFTFYYTWGEYMLYRPPSVTFSGERIREREEVEVEVEPTEPEVTIQAEPMPVVDRTPSIPESLRHIPVRKNKRRISQGEQICRRTMEAIYGVPFPSCYPEWLVNPETGRRLEIDCYNSDLKIGVEYNGIQHYCWPNFTTQSYDEFIRQVRRDMLKVDLCDKHGVYLIVVPYNVPHEIIPDYIAYYLPDSVRQRLSEDRVLDTVLD